MEFPWPQWMEWVIAGGSSVVAIFALQIIDRIQGPKK
jgi:hypothetical protein